MGDGKWGVGGGGGGRGWHARRLLSDFIRHMWVEFVVGSLLAPRGFSPVILVTPPPLLRNQHFQIPFRSGINVHAQTSSESSKVLRGYPPR